MIIYFFYVVFLSKCFLELIRILEYTSGISYSFVVSPLIMWPVRNVTRSWAKYSNAIINYIVHLSEVDESPLYVSSSSNEVSWIAEYGFNKKGMLSHYFHSFLTRDYYWYFILRYIYSFSILLLEILVIIEFTIYFFFAENNWQTSKYTKNRHLFSSYHISNSFFSIFTHSRVFSFISGFSQFFFHFINKLNI